jgi:hypothetical protein
MAPVTTGQIYWGAVPFVLIQVLMIALVIVFPQMVMVYKAGESTVDPSKVQILAPPPEPGGAVPGQPESQDQMRREDVQENKEAESLQNLFNTPSPKK